MSAVDSESLRSKYPVCPSIRRAGGDEASSLHKVSAQCIVTAPQQEGIMGAAPEPPLSSPCLNAGLETQSFPLLEK